jgi:hypothetical protein
MDQFIYLFRASEEGSRAAMGTPEAAQKSLDVWLAWIRQLDANGHLESPGQPLSPSGRVVRGPQKTVSDGPYIESKDLVLGFIIVKARDLAQAVELAKGCPMLAGDGSVEVRPIGTLPS